METIAVYWESMIRTYGFEVRRDLQLFRLIPGDEPATALDALALEGESADLLMTTAVRRPKGDLVLEIVVSGALGNTLRAHTDADAETFRQLAEVDVVFLHGPHYGDRYGIAAAALGALGRASLEVLSCSCAGASIFVAVAAGRADDAVAALSTAFVVPCADGAQHP